MSNVEGPNEKIPEFIRVEELFQEYRITKSHEKRDQIVEEIEANLDAAQAQGHDVDFYWSEFDALMRIVTEIEYPQAIKIIQKHIKGQAKKPN